MNNATMGPFNSKMRRIAVAPTQEQEKPFVDRRLIRPPSYGDTLWNAMRVRNFMRRIMKNSMWRGTYVNNITYLAALHGKNIGARVDPYVFMYTVNPILFGKSLGWSDQEIFRLIGHWAWPRLMRRIRNSSCAECRAMVNTEH